MTTRWPIPNLLDDLSRERDACGIGLVVDAKGRASRELLDRALAGLAATTGICVGCEVYLALVKKRGGVKAST